MVKVRRRDFISEPGNLGLTKIMGDDEVKISPEEINTAMLRTAFDEVCKAANVYQGCGPPMAYFQTPPNADGNWMRVTYEAFDMAGPRAEGLPMPREEIFAVALGTAVASFRAWLKPNRTLVWRCRPEVDQDARGFWTIYYRCIQLDDNAQSMAIDWHF